VDHCAVSENGQVKGGTIERHKLRLQLSDFIDERCDQVPFRAFADMGRSAALNRRRVGRSVSRMPRPRFAWHLRLQSHRTMTIDRCPAGSCPWLDRIRCSEPKPPCLGLADAQGSRNLPNGVSILE
jgi:hypothetical protein